MIGGKQGILVDGAKRKVDAVSRIWVELEYVETHAERTTEIGTPTKKRALLEQQVERVRCVRSEVRDQAHNIGILSTDMECYEDKEGHYDGSHKDGLSCR